MSELEPLSREPLRPELPLDPGALGEEIVRAFGENARGLAALLEQILYTAQSTGTRALGLEERLDALNEKLNETNELLHNLIQVLHSTG